MIKEKQKEIDDIEPEMLENPKGVDMCQYEEKVYSKCSTCPKQIEDMTFCKLNTIGWRLGQLDKAIGQMNYTLTQILNELKQR